jgi:hypothetical protein
LCCYPGTLLSLLRQQQWHCAAAGTEQGPTAARAWAKGCHHSSKSAEQNQHPYIATITTTGTAPNQQQQQQQQQHNNNFLLCSRLWWQT